MFKPNKFIQKDEPEYGSEMVVYGEHINYPNVPAQVYFYKSQLGVNFSQMTIYYKGDRVFNGYIETVQDFNTIIRCLGVNR